MLYQLYEMNHAVVAPWRAAANASRALWNAPINPLAETYFGRAITAGLDVFERVTRRYGKPAFGIHQTEVEGKTVAVEEEVVWRKPFCELVHFKKKARVKQPKLLLVAPMSGHFATLLRGTVRTMLGDHDVYITDWVDAKQVPLSLGQFGLDDYVDYLIDILRVLGPDTAVMAVCQPSVPVLSAVSVMSDRGDPNAPAAMILMGGPIDTRRNPTEVNKLASQHDIEWFRSHVINAVPIGAPGFMREVYPGFLQLTGFMTMNLDRHISAHRDLFWHLVKGDGDSAEKHDEFYDEYLSVMDLTAEFYLETVERVFIKHQLPKGEMTHRGQPVRPEAITKTALMTVEGELDDISGVGQTEAAHDLCRNIPQERRQHHLQPGVGHYGVFNGSRFARQIAPRIKQFIRDNMPA
ncbi:polyhydroxyalkanoate depolymerase [Rhodoligotrophos ferricapiens]|uniref:polyhydroxyalkanoate depolymerase n=1 Tax=Rhodoligotrophos ferricapiens TaxID=3069264 RepID=UPI00315CF786